jgi:hypothetical protein
LSTSQSLILLEEFSAILTDALRNHAVVAIKPGFERVYKQKHHVVKELQERKPAAPPAAPVAPVTKVKKKSRIEAPAILKQEAAKPRARKMKAYAPLRSEFDRLYGNSIPCLKGGRLSSCSGVSLHLAWHQVSALDLRQQTD